MKIFDYDGYPAVFLHEVSEALQDRDCKLALLEEEIDRLEGRIDELLDERDGYRSELRI